MRPSVSTRSPVIVLLDKGDIVTLLGQTDRCRDTHVPGAHHRGADRNNASSRRSSRWCSYVTPRRRQTADDEVYSNLGLRWLPETARLVGLEG